MAAQFTRDGLLYLIRRIADATLSADSLFIHLLSSPLPGGTLATWSLAKEVEYTGYAPVEIEPADFKVSAPTAAWVLLNGPLMVFQPTDNAVAASAAGIAWTWGDGPAPATPKLIAVESFGMNRTMNGPDN